MNEVESAIRRDEDSVEYSRDNVDLSKNYPDEFKELLETLKTITDTYYNQFENHAAYSTEYHATNYFKRFYAKEVKTGLIGIYDERILSYPLHTYSWLSEELFEPTSHFKQFRQLSKNGWKNYALLAKSINTIAILDLDNMVEVTETQIEGSIAEILPIQEVISQDVENLYQDYLKNLDRLKLEAYDPIIDLRWARLSIKFWSKTVEYLKDCAGNTGFISYRPSAISSMAASNKNNTATSDPNLRLAKLDLSKLFENFIKIEELPTILIESSIPLSKAVKVSDFDSTVYSIIHKSMIVL